MSRTFSMNSGSVDSLKLSARQGWRPKAAQMRVTAVWFSPIALAIEHGDQWVASAGFSWRVLTITSSTLSSPILRGAPGRGSSNRPSRRWTTKRRRHLPTVAWLTPSLAATSWLVAPLAAARMMRARRASACEVLRRFVSRSRTARSSALRISSAFGRPRGRDPVRGEVRGIDDGSIFAAYSRVRTLGAHGQSTALSHPARILRQRDCGRRSTASSIS